MDIDPYSGRLFAYVYETGDENLRRIAHNALIRFSDKNILDFTVFRSAIEFEKGVVGFAKKLMNGESAVGSYTYGGTESIMLAVKSARDLFRKRSNSTPEIVVPITIHPSFYKSADYMGLRVKRVGIDERKKADIDAINESVTDRTALIALSAPNWPYGTVDPIEEVSEIALDRNIPLHVDACLGGFILPFFEKIGEKVPLFDFRVEGVTSISLDIHKYGYAPKGASVVLFRTPELKKHSMYVDVSSPGYVFVNQAVLSSRSIGPLASAYAVIRYLGEDGYKSLAKKVLSARDKIYGGLRGLGFRSVGDIESSVLSLYNSEIELTRFVSNMRLLGWHTPLQRGLSEYNIPLNIHLTISPIHDSLAEEFIRDAEKAIEMPSEETTIFNAIKSGDFQKILEYLNTGKVDSAVIPLILDAIPEEVAVEMVKEIVIRWFE
jgi:glutamate/tyrosine decarboxylase-like PLP-dependent enzyme